MERRFRFSETARFNRESHEFRFIQSHNDAPDFVREMIYVDFSLLLDDRGHPRPAVRELAANPVRSMNANSRRSHAQKGLSAGEKRATGAILSIKSKINDNAILSFVKNLRHAVHFVKKIVA